MPTLAIDKGFITDLSKMEKVVAKRVAEVFDEFDAATHTGLHLEKIVNARNPRFRSIRIDQAWRGIVLAPVTGDVYTLIPVEKILTTVAAGDRNGLASNDSSVRGGGRERQRTGAVTALTSGSRLGKQRDQVASCFAEMVEDRLPLLRTG